MNKLVGLIVFIVVGAVLWWALTEVLAVLALPAIVETLAIVAFVVIIVLVIADYIMSGSWFWKRP